MMARVLLCGIICAILFIELANASTACANATQDLYTHSSGICYPKLTTFGDRDLCNTSSLCRGIVDEILTYCNSSDFLYIEVFNALELLCTAPPRCFNATKDIQNDYFCDIARMNLSIADPNLVCNGSCRALLDGLVNDCGNNYTGAGIQADLEAVCSSPTTIVPTPTSTTSTTSSIRTTSMARTTSTTSTTSTTTSTTSSTSTTSTDDYGFTSTANSGASTSISHHHPTPTIDAAACNTAVQLFSNNTNCASALNATNIGALCKGTCRTLLNSVVASCGDSGFVTQSDIDKHCGACALRMGILAVLLMALAAAMAL